MKSKITFFHRCEIFDFHCNCCTKGLNTPNYTPRDADHIHSHTGMMEWVYNYYSRNTSSQATTAAKSQNGNVLAYFSKNDLHKDSKQAKDQLPCGPLYFQHHGK
jgi:hypothetical protein